MTDVVVRSPTWDDFSAFYELYKAENIENFGGFTLSLDETKAEWQLPNFNPETDVQGVFAGDEMIAYAEIYCEHRPPVRPYLYGYVHPAHRGQGYGTRLTQWGLQRARQLINQVPSEARVVLQSFSQHSDGRQLLEDFGFVNTRQSWIMEIEFDAPPDPPTLPDGMRLITMAEGATLEDIARLHQKTFQDHRGFQPKPLTEALAGWKVVVAGVSNFDPALYAIIKVGEQDVGVITVNPVAGESEDLGEVGILGVVSAYRRRGIGGQLLNFAFHRLYARGQVGCTLNVDAASLTGATRIYERAGMYKKQVFYAYELQLRGGVELSKQ